ncbi:uncharacterized protein B0H18DRAFT_1217941 [Fomitopsis serialis]|uniref:uncharacterized protein n=1 Tax=Fomitopsis serialis TaxID=139415 RepID=UPI0020081DCD|nr:uncharacterized protein B0H18DRAFT_1217941 [Neoantrodia serialis]KAH9911661.1 hypothetical protein B0H18DRAFT_1217941 [Neoantrodia serialis]
MDTECGNVPNANYCSRPISARKTARWSLQDAFGSELTQSPFLTEALINQWIELDDRVEWHVAQDKQHIGVASSAGVYNLSSATPDTGSGSNEGQYVGVASRLKPGEISTLVEAGQIEVYAFLRSPFARESRTEAAAVGEGWEAAGDRWDDDSEIREDEL